MDQKCNTNVTEAQNNQKSLGELINYITVVRFILKLKYSFYLNVT